MPGLVVFISSKMKKVHLSIIIKVYLSILLSVGAIRFMDSLEVV